MGEMIRGALAVARPRCADRATRPTAIQAIRIVAAPAASNRRVRALRARRQVVPREAVTDGVHRRARNLVRVLPTPFSFPWSLLPRRGRCRRWFFNSFARDHDLLHLGGAFVDAQRPDLAIKLLDLDALGDAEPAMELHGAVDDALRGLGGDAAWPCAASRVTRAAP